jgi:hypothetical protein
LAKAEKTLKEQKAFAAFVGWTRLHALTGNVGTASGSESDGRLERVIPEGSEKQSQQIFEKQISVKAMKCLAETEEEKTM